jgi:hypothetical protein
MPITIENRRDLVEGLIPLFLHVVWRLMRQDVPFEEALNTRTDIYRFTSLFDGTVIPYHALPGWRDVQWDGMLSRLRLIYDRHAADTTSEAFERKGYEVFRPVLEPAFARGIAQWPRIEDRPYGFFTYNLADLPQPAVRAIELHLANPFAPASPFADSAERMRELQRLVTDVRRDYPDVTHVATGTWLNSFPPFLAFFPPEWAASATPSTAAFPGAGLWGQFSDRRGGFHRKNAEHLRSTGEFLYPPINCQCRIDVVMAYLGAGGGISYIL